jgi:hypothetical protein
VIDLEPEDIPCDDWAEAIVQDAAFRHVARSRLCRGYTMSTSGRAWCGSCSWCLSGRPQDAATRGGARFAQAALGRVGEAMELVVGVVVQAVWDAMAPACCRTTLARAMFI